jgi:hypothetical protein
MNQPGCGQSTYWKYLIIPSAFEEQGGQPPRGVHQGETQKMHQPPAERKKLPTMPHLHLFSPFSEKIGKKIRVATPAATAGQPLIKFISLIYPGVGYYCLRGPFQVRCNKKTKLGNGERPLALSRKIP